MWWWRRTLLLAGTAAMAVGCESLRKEPVDPLALHVRALAFLKHGASFPDNPVIRAQAIEALHDVAPEQGLPWFREALSDPHAGVRFAACIVLGTMRHEPSKPLLERRLEDDNQSVKAAAIYAMHQLGDASRTAQLAELLLYASDETTRANTALVLSKLAEPGAVKLLERAMSDASSLVRLQVLEAMALLGDPGASEQLTMHAHGGPGPWQVTALLAVARSEMPNRVPLLEHRFRYGKYVETQLAAARGLGWVGRNDGYDLACRMLRFNRPAFNERNPDDTAGNQVMRIRSMAALALGAIGDERALPELQDALDSQDDMRVRLAAAAGLAEILNRNRAAAAAETE